MYMIVLMITANNLHYFISYYCKISMLQRHIYQWAVDNINKV